jgi:hypothetical protein
VYQRPYFWGSSKSMESKKYSLHTCRFMQTPLDHAWVQGQEWQYGSTQRLNRWTVKYQAAFQQQQLEQDQCLMSKLEDQITNWQTWKKNNNSCNVRWVLTSFKKWCYCGCCGKVNYIVTLFVMAPASLVGGYQHFEKGYCLHLPPITIKMGEVCVSVTVVTTYQTNWCYDPENHTSWTFITMQTSDLI